MTPPHKGQGKEFFRQWNRVQEFLSQEKPELVRTKQMSSSLTVNEDQEDFVRNFDLFLGAIMSLMDKRKTVTSSD